MDMTQNGLADPNKTKRFWSKWIVFGIGLTVIGLVYFQYRDSLSLDSLAQQETPFRLFQQQHPFLIYAATFIIYVAVTGLSLPGATGMSLFIGWFFGFLRGTVLVSFASTTGATLAFLLSRYLLRNSIQNRFGQQLERFNQALESEGTFYLLTLRLIPAVPFFAINVIMGLTPIRTWTFWWVSQLGMFAGTCVYVYAGSTVPDLQTLAEQGVHGILTPRIFVAFVILGVFPIVVKKIIEYLRPAKKCNTMPDKK